MRRTDVKAPDTQSVETCVENVGIDGVKWWHCDDFGGYHLLSEVPVDVRSLADVVV